MTPLATTGTGLVVRGGLPAVTAVELLSRGIDAGLAPVFVTEVTTTAATAAAAAVAARRPGARLGTAVVPLGSRSPAALAMEATTIAALAGAPFRLGVGTSAPRIVEGWHGAPYDASLATTRARLRELRGLLAGDDHGGSALPTDGPGVELLLGALGPRMLELAYDEASGAVVNLAPVDAIEAPPAGSVLYAAVWVRASADADLRCRRELVSYAMSPPYARHLTRLGYGAVVDEVHGLYRTGRLRDAPEMLPDELVDALYVDLDALGPRLAGYRAAGAHPLVLPVTGADPASEADHVLAAFGHADVTARPPGGTDRRSNTRDPAEGTTR